MRGGEREGGRRRRRRRKEQTGMLTKNQSAKLKTDASGICQLRETLSTV